MEKIPSHVNGLTPSFTCEASDKYKVKDASGILCNWFPTRTSLQKRMQSQTRGTGETVLLWSFGEAKTHGALHGQVPLPKLETR